MLSTLATAGAVSATCNPLNSACDAVPALGGSLNTDFTNGASSRYDPTLAVNKISYGDKGVDFQISASGDNPSIDSDFYIMFGHVEFVAQAAPGVGIVSSMVLISDDNDEIDIEWLGGDGTQVQSNYFSKGDTSTYTRGAFHEIASPQTTFYTYAIDWTSERIIWYVNGAPVRTLANPGTGYYPQSPMKVRFGSWAGGDSSNAPGTIQWAGGLTDYSTGPFNFYVKSLNVQDYSTGTAYKFTDQSGSWTAVQATNGKVNGNLDGSAPAQSQSVSSESASSSTEPVTSTQIATSIASSTSSDPSSTTQLASSTQVVSSTESSSSESASTTESSTSTQIVSSIKSSSSSVLVSSTESATSNPATSTQISSTTDVSSFAKPSSSFVNSTITVGISSSTTFAPVITTSTAEPSVKTTTTVVIPSFVSKNMTSVFVEKTSTSTVNVNPTTSKVISTKVATPTLSTVFSSSIPQVTTTTFIPQVNGASQRIGSSVMAFAGFLLASLAVF